MADELSTGQHIEHVIGLVSKPSILLTLTKLQHASAKMPITISLRRRKGQGQPSLVRTLRTSFVSGESPGRLIRYSLMLTVVPQRLNGRCLNQKPRNILSAEWIGLSSTQGQSNSVKFAPIWPQSTRTYHARNCGILTMRGEDTQYELPVSRLLFCREAAAAEFLKFAYGMRR